MAYTPTLKKHGAIRNHLPSLPPFNAHPNQILHPQNTQSTQPSRFYYLVKQYLFPYVYWNLFPQGKWFGRRLTTPYDFSADDARVGGA